MLRIPLDEIIAVTTSQGADKRPASSPGCITNAGTSSMAAGNCINEAHRHNRASNPSRVSGAASLIASGSRTSGARRNNIMPH
jgi:hypothetical protein